MLEWANDTANKVIKAALEDAALESVVALSEENHRLKREVDVGRGDLWTSNDRPEEIAMVTLAKLSPTEARRVAETILSRLKANSSLPEVQHPEVYADRLQAEVTRSEHPQAYFGGAVALSKVIRWEVGQANEFDRVLTPEEIMDKLEQRVGPKAGSCLSSFCVRSTRSKLSNWQRRKQRRIVRSESR